MGSEAAAADQRWAQQVAWRRRGGRKLGDVQRRAASRGGEAASGRTRAASRGGSASTTCGGGIGANKGVPWYIEAFASSSSMSMSTSASKFLSTGRALGSRPRSTGDSSFRRSSSGLPDLQLRPLTFDEVYAESKARAVRRMREMKKDGSAPLPLPLSPKQPLPDLHETAASQPTSRTTGSRSRPSSRSGAQGMPALAISQQAQRGPEGQPEVQHGSTVPAAVMQQQDLLGAGVPPDPTRTGSPGPHPTPSSPSRPPSGAVRYRSESKRTSVVEQQSSLQGSARKGETCSRAGDLPLQPRQFLAAVDPEPKEAASVGAARKLSAEVTPEQQEQLSQEQKLKHLRMVFNRFKVPGEPDLHVDDLVELLRFLGYCLVKQASVGTIAQEVTTYDYMDFGEFCSFVEKYEAHEQQLCRDIFDRNDADGGGTISVKEVRPLLHQLGFLPRRMMIDETLQKVDKNGNGELDFAELQVFISAYHENEGFTLAEVQELRKQFNLLGEQNEQGDVSISPRKIGPVLGRAFGLQEVASATPFVERLERSRGVGRTMGFHTSAHEFGLRISFEEMLMVARMVRESQFQRLIDDNLQLSVVSSSKDKLVKDASASIRKKTASPTRMIGTTSLRTPRTGSNSLRTPRSFELREEYSEASGIVDEIETTMADGLVKVPLSSGKTTVTYENLRQYLAARGYTPLKQVMAEMLEEVVNGWKQDCELDAAELFDFIILQNQRDGFGKSDIARFQDFFTQFDQDTSGEISVLELSKMLRWLGYGLNSSESHSLILAVDEDNSGQLDEREFLRLLRLMREKDLQKVRLVFNSMATLHGKMPGKKLSEALAALDQGQPANMKLMESFGNFSLDDLVGVIDSVREGYVQKERKKAGFTEEELEYYEAVYVNCDKDGNGVMSALELLEVLETFGWAPRTCDEQSALVLQMEEAKRKTEEAGVECPGGQFVNFWQYLQLVRLLQDENDRKQEEDLQTLRAELHFTEADVDQFRQVFRGYAKKDNVTIIVAARVLHPDSIKRVIASLGVKLSRNLSEALERKLKSFDENMVIGFLNFLRLMRWLLDTNFGCVNDSVEQQLVNERNAVR